MVGFGMSSQKGNLQRTRRQLHANVKAFKNDLHDTTVQMKRMKQLNVEGVCLRCKDIIEWRIKYRKYKALTVPKKCTRCQQKTILLAYHVICIPCANKIGVCGKCGKPDKEEKETVDDHKNVSESNDKLIRDREERTLSKSSEKDADEEIAALLMTSAIIQGNIQC